MDLVKLILNFFFAEPNFQFIQYAGPKPNIKNLFLWLSTFDDELLSTPKSITFLAVSLSKLHELPLSNAIPYSLYT